ncbi:hypothetical protein G7Y79_00002g007320 [Physcia stellaris]|nr:hypothetical protein G7Y79_00002g007320 [Physcia stellaris]
MESSESTIFEYMHALNFRREEEGLKVEDKEEEQDGEGDNSSLESPFTEEPSSFSSPPATATREKSPEALAKIAVAAAKSEQSFPEGKYEIMETSATRLLCGFYSVINSMKAQYPSLPYATHEELQDIFDANMKDVDQIAGVLYGWGLEKGFNLQVGYLEEGEAPLLLSHPAEKEEDVLVVWIHNDSNWKGGIGHYSGMKAKGQLSEGK